MLPPVRCLGLGAGYKWWEDNGGCRWGWGHTTVQATAGVTTIYHMLEGNRARLGTMLVEIFLHVLVNEWGTTGKMRVSWMLNEDVDRVTGGCMRGHRALCGVEGVTVTSTALLLLKRTHFKQVRQPRYWSWLRSGGCLNCIDTDETFTFQEFLLFTKFFQLAAVCVFQTEQWADIWGRELVPIFINLILVPGHQHNIIIAVGLLLCCSCCNNFVFLNPNSCSWDNISSPQLVTLSQSLSGKQWSSDLRPTKTNWNQITKHISKIKNNESSTLKHTFPEIPISKFDTGAL